jgi:hypothetical protein
MNLMAKSEATPEGADRRRSSTRATARDHPLTRNVAAEHINPYPRGAFWQRRNAYDGNGEYEYPTARHYVPNYTECFILHEVEADRMKFD